MTNDLPVWSNTRCVLPAHLVGATCGVSSIVGLYTLPILVALLVAVVLLVANFLFGRWWIDRYADRHRQLQDAYFAERRQQRLAEFDAHVARLNIFQDRPQG